MRSRVFSAVTAGALALAVATAFAPAAGAKTSGITSSHRGMATAVRVNHNSTTAVLYNQNNNDSTVGIVSQNFETANDIYDSQGADSFKIPLGQTWKIKRVDVTGVYFNGPGLAVSENVTIYKNSHGLPGATVYAATVAGADNGVGSFQIPVAKSLGSGKYWVSVQANMDFSVGGEWGWETRTTQAGLAAAWQNPGDGFGSGCTVYANMQGCIGALGEGPDYMFALVGKKV
jgi:hypothetical protein